MKILATSLFLSAVLYGQGPGPVNVTPGGVTVQAPAAQAPKPIPPDAVVAEVNGKKYTAAEFDHLIAMLPPQYQQAARGRPQLVSQVLLMEKLSEDAQKSGLADKSPYKEQLEMTRLQVLSTAELSDVNNNIQLTGDEEQKYYQDNADKFKEVKVRVIYVSFKPGAPVAKSTSVEEAAKEAVRAAQSKAAGEKKSLTEADAEAKIQDLEKQIKAGADFGKLARENSDDKASAAKDGDFGVIKQDSAYPPAIKNAVFALKQGEVSAPIKEANGFYLIRAEEVSEQPMTEVMVQIVQAVRQAKFQQWMKGLQSQYDVKIENPSYFVSGVPNPLPPAH